MKLNPTAELIFPLTAYTREQLIRAEKAIAQGADPASLDPWYMDRMADQMGLPLSQREVATA